MKPILDRVIIKQDQGVEKIGALYVPDSARIKPKQGTIVAVGPGAISNDNSRLPMETKVGDKVFYGEFSGAEVQIDGEPFIVIKENELFLIL